MHIRFPLKKKWVILCILLMSLWLSLAPAARADEGPGFVGDAGVLCLPGVYLDGASGCAPLGPSLYLNHLAEKGFAFPQSPLPASRPDPALTLVNVRYGLVNKPNAPVYASLEDALRGNKRNAIRRIDAVFSYISYIDEVVVEGKRFYQIEPGAWMTANDVVRLGSVPLFQGLTFARTPDRPFGWVLTYLSNGPLVTRPAPGAPVDEGRGRLLNNHEIVQIYAVETVNGEDWYMIGPDEWLPGKVVARVIPNPIPPAGVTGERWIEVNLYEQTLAVYDHKQLVFATLIASGLEPFWTRPGLFQIYKKLETTPMQGSFEVDRSDAYYLEDVPWTMYFDQARALHGAYWRANLGFPQSHGCVNLSVGDAHWIYNWAQEGDWVYVWDPSGKTPVDPSLYTAGGA